MESIRSNSVASRPRCLVAGLGYAGCQAVDALRSQGMNHVDLLMLDTDQHDLASFAPGGVRQLLLGEEATGGNGVGSDVELASACISDAGEQLSAELSGRSIFVLVAGLGGCTGGAAADVLQFAEEEHVPCILLAVMPLPFESEARRRRAMESLGQVEMFCQVVVLVPFEELGAKFREEPAERAYAIVSEYLASAAAGLVAPFAARSLLNGSPSVLASLGMDSTPRCRLVLAEGSGPGATSEVIASVTEQLRHRASEIDRGVALLRLHGSCRQGDIEAVMNGLSALLPHGNLETVACLDHSLEGRICLTLLLHSEEYLEDEQPELREVLASRRSLASLYHFPEQTRGLFAGDKENNYRGQDLDVPTFRRCGIAIDKGS
ncbi:MAG: hypothetical protein IJJ26_05745 [Victivallales bacterium]|nr:hypothetical protein [Victivallales bacterium]